MSARYIEQRRITPFESASRPFASPLAIRRR
jgi:hypothetical protein